MARMRGDPQEPADDRRVPAEVEPRLVGDVGGTNARFALADPAAPMPLLGDDAATYPVDEFPSLADAARHYLDATGARPRGTNEPDPRACDGGGCASHRPCRAPCPGRPAGSRRR